MIERTLVLVKPDGVARGLIGEIISRLEQRGLKIVSIKVVRVPDSLVKKHYDYDDVVKRRGEFVWKKLVKFLSGHVVVAIVIEGIHAIEVVRKISGDTEPKSALPGTIRGDFAHHSYKFADSKNIALANLVHASSDAKDAKREIKLWFKEDEIISYKRSDESWHYGG